MLKDSPTDHLPGCTRRLAPTVAFAGGGLASGLIAYRLAQKFPQQAFAIVEQNDRLGGNHTWSFHESDVTPDQHDWLEPFIVHRWDKQQVLFPDRQRTLATGYRSITSERFDEVIRAVSNIEIINDEVGGVAFDTIETSGDIRLEATVIDGRGFYPSRHLTLGWQKFLGQHLKLTAPHGLDAPIIMDATVPQLGGYRFVYVLPFTDTEVLIEDTYYADGDALETGTLRDRIADYAGAHGWHISEVIREEDGILPITLDGDIEAFWNERGMDQALAGLRAGLFHPVTGYSLPDAVRLADLLTTTDLGPMTVREVIRSYAIETWHSQRFYRLLNRMLFWAAKPTERYKVLQRFYSLSPRLIERFYAGQNTLADKIRLLAGKPPVPIHRALPCLAGRHPDGISPTTERA